MSDLTQLRKDLGSADRHRRAQAAVEIGQRGDTQSMDRLRELAADPDDLVAIAATYGCWQLGFDTVPIERMVAALSSSDEELVQESVFALCEMGEAIVPKLTTLLSASAAADARAILRILADIGSDLAFDAVSNFSTNDPDLLGLVGELIDDWDE